jgi:hypothetical protein
MNDSDAEDEDRDINSLPDELLLTLFKYFSPSFICKSISLVCKRWAEVASDATLWEACHCHVGRRWRCKGFPVRQEFICAKLCHLKVGSRIMGMVYGLTDTMIDYEGFDPSQDSKSLL